MIGHRGGLGKLIQRRSSFTAACSSSARSESATFCFQLIIRASDYYDVIVLWLEIFKNHVCCFWKILLYIVAYRFDQQVTALEYYNKSLDKGIRLLGENHFKVANTYTAIGNVYYIKSDFVKSLEYYNKSLAINCQVLGENHPDVARTFRSISKLYSKQNNFQDALLYAQKSITSLVAEFNDLNYYSNPSLKSIRLEQYLL